MVNCGVCNLPITLTKVGPVYQDSKSLSVGGFTRFSPVSPEHGMYETSDSLNPACFRNTFNFASISSKRSFDQPTVSSLLMTTPSWLTPRDLYFYKKNCKRIRSIVKSYSIYFDLLEYKLKDNYPRTRQRVRMHFSLKLRKFMFHFTFLRCC